jgi:hypothetical protein
MVSPALIQDMLPTGMKVQATMTIQAPGVAKFATPLPLTMPNIYGAAAGTQLFFYSYDHTTGQASIEGTATVSGDGTTVTTDPGSGINAPGWHFISPAGSFGSGGGPPGCGGPPPSLDPPPDTPEDTEEDNDPIVEPVIYGDGTDDGTGEFKLSWTAPDKLPDTPPPPPPPGGACPPPRPQDPPNEHQPYITVTIDVDGPLKDYMEQKGDLDLTSQSFTLQAGSGETKTFDMVAKSYDDMFPDGLESVDNDILYGSEIKVTEVTGNPDGSKHTEISKYDLYRFVNATNPVGAVDQTVDLSTAAADGAT